MPEAPPAPPKGADYSESIKLREAPPVAEPAPPLDIYAAILAASSMFGPIEKDADNSYLKSRYISLGGLLRAVREPLSNMGVIITSAFVQCGSSFVVETTLRHIPSGTEISSSFPVLDLSNPQKVGSCATYGFRYNLLQLLGIAAADDDGNSLSNPGQWMGPDPSGQQRPAPVHTATNPQQPEPWL